MLFKFLLAIRLALPEFLESFINSLVDLPHFLGMLFKFLLALRLALPEFLEFSFIFQTAFFH
jgi:hypothetical protein